MILRRCAWGSRDPGKKSCRTRSIRSSAHLCCLQVRLESWEVSSCLELRSYGARLVVPSWDRCRKDSTLGTPVQISTSLWSSLLNTGSGWYNMVHHDRSCQPKLRKLMRSFLLTEAFQMVRTGLLWNRGSVVFCSRSVASRCSLGAKFHRAWLTIGSRGNLRSQW